MNKYRVTAMLNDKQVIDEVEATSEEHAWVVASNKHLPERPLYNGKVEELPTREEQAATIAQLREVATAAREYLDISDVPRIHGDYCKYCEADVTAAHEKDCEFIIKVTSLVAALAALEQETK